MQACIGYFGLCVCRLFGSACGPSRPLFLWPLSGWLGVLPAFRVLLPWRHSGVTSGLGFLSPISGLGYVFPSIRVLRILVGVGRVFGVGWSWVVLSFLGLLAATPRTALNGRRQESAATPGRLIPRVAPRAAEATRRGGLSAGSSHQSQTPRGGITDRRNVILPECLTGVLTGTLQRSSRGMDPGTS